MPDIKISAMPTVASADVDGSDSVPVIAAGANKRITFDELDSRYASSGPSGAALYESVTGVVLPSGVGTLVNLTVPANTFKAGDLVQFMGSITGPNAGYDGSNNYLATLVIGGQTFDSIDYANDSATRLGAGVALYLVTATNLFRLNAALGPTSIPFNPAIANSVVWTSAVAAGSPNYAVVLLGFAVLFWPS